jgi:hypothetical protein
MWSEMYLSQSSGRSPQLPFGTFLNKSSPRFEPAAQVVGRQTASPVIGIRFAVTRLQVP